MTTLKHISQCKINIPEKFEVEINYKEHKEAKRASYYPGVTLAGTHTVTYTAKDVKEFATTRMFIL